MNSDKQEIKQAILKVLRAKAGVWLNYDELSSAVTETMNQPIWQGAFYRAIYELHRDRTIERTRKDIYHKELRVNETLYRVPDNETLDMFGELEEKK